MQIPVTTVLYHLDCVSVFDLLLCGLCLNFLNSFFLEGRSLTFIDHTMF